MVDEWVEWVELGLYFLRKDVWRMGIFCVVGETWWPDVARLIQRVRR